MLNKFLYKVGGDQCRGSQLVNMCRINRIVISQSFPAKYIRNYHRKRAWRLSESEVMGISGGEVTFFRHNSNNADMNS